MIVHHETPYSRVLIAEEPLSGVAIQSGSTSSTLLPVCCHVDGADGVAVWDMPGSQDTRGPFVELIVHKIYEWMLVNGKTLRFVLVSPPPTERPQRAALEKAINSSLISEENATIVYTKCSREFDPRSTAGLQISDEKQNIRSFAMREPRFVDREGHDYSSEHQDLKLDVLKTLAELRPASYAFVMWILVYALEAVLVVVDVFAPRYSMFADANQPAQLRLCFGATCVLNVIWVFL